jgi:formylglycine-generating enzyme required for sulfatase activity
MALVGDHLCVDRWEASLVEVLADGTERASSPFETLPAGPVRLRAVSRAGVLPQGYISGEQAQAACRNAGKRLCTETEWARACRGPQDTTFPYGPDRIDGTCNDDGRKEHPVV